MALYVWQDSGVSMPEARRMSPWFPGSDSVEHEETDDEAPPQIDEQPAREGGHDE